MSDKSSFNVFVDEMLSHVARGLGIVKIEPALTPEQWEDFRAMRAKMHDALGADLLSAYGGASLPPAMLIAMNNDLLSDDDPRKITLAIITDIRSSAEQLRLRPEFDDDVTRAARLDAFAAALESYLPPDDRQRLRVERGGLSKMPSDFEQQLRDRL